MTSRTHAAVLFASIVVLRAYQPDPRIQDCCPDLYANRESQPLLRGFIDPTQPPYNAVGDGVSDDTDALQQAVGDAYLAQMPVTLPADRTFLLSRQLRLVQDSLIKPLRQYGFQLLGATSGKRPVLRLKDGSDVASGPVEGKDMPVFIFFALVQDGKSNAPSHYSARLRNVEIDVGKNPTVAAVSMSGAQLCSIEDVEIYGEEFFAGVVNLPGSGGFTVGLNVTGGQYGIYQIAFRPNPSVANAALIGQTRAGVFISTSRGPLVLSGVHMKPAGGAVGVHMESTSTNGGILIEDGCFQFWNHGSVAINNSRGGDVVLKNTFVKASVIVSSGSGPSTRMLAGDIGAWLNVPRYGYTGSMSGLWQEGQDLGTAVPASYPAEASAAQASTYPDVAQLRELHGWRRLVPAFDTQYVADVAADYGATPEWVDASDDDGPAIQRALNDAGDPSSPRYGAVVFVPHGTFHVRSTLHVPGGVAFVGGSTLRSLIHMVAPDLWQGGPMIRVAGDREGAVVSDIGLYGWHRTSFLHVESPGVLFRDLLTELNTTDSAHSTKPLPDTAAVSVFSGQASGRTYGLSLDHVSWSLNTAGMPPLVLVNGTSSPLHFYGLSAEHHFGANPQVLVAASKDVHFHALKYESGLSTSALVSVGSLVSIVASHEVSVFGGSGNYNLAREDVHGIFEISGGSTQVELAGLIRKKMSDQPDLAGKAIAIDLDSGASIGNDRGLLLFSPEPGLLVV